MTRIATASGIVAALRREPRHRDEVVADADRHAETCEDLEDACGPDEDDPIGHHQLDGHGRVVVERVADLDQQATAGELLRDVIA
jgi:hypothetical protein